MLRSEQCITEGLGWPSGLLGTWPAAPQSTPPGVPRDTIIKMMQQFRSAGCSNLSVLETPLRQRGIMPGVSRKLRMFVAHFMRSKSSTGRGRTDQNSVRRSNIYINALNNPTPSRGPFLSSRPSILHNTWDLLDVSREHATDSMSDSVKNVKLNLKSARKLPSEKPFAAHSGAVENVLSVMYSLDSPVYSTALKSVSLAEFRALRRSHHHGPRNHAGKTFCF